MKNKMILIFLSFLLGVFIPLLAHPELKKSPSCYWASKSYDVNNSDDQFDKVRDFISETMKRNKIVSIAVAVSKDGKIIWEEAFGWANKEKELKATPQTIYALASISKPITATGLMVLVERSLVNLDKPVNDYLGAAKLHAYVGNPSEVTVRRVLQHTAGLPMHGNIFFSTDTSRPPDMEESIKRYGIIVNDPGSEFYYSNFGYGIIDHIISNVSRKSYVDFMKSEVFEPLGLTHTSVLVDPSLKEYVAQNYDERGMAVNPLDYDHRGASAVCSSAHDLVRFGMFHLKNRLPDQKRILSNKSLNLMHASSLVKTPNTGLGEVWYGLGWTVIDLAGYRFLNHTGGMTGATTRLTMIPSENIAVAVLSNIGMLESYDLWDIEWRIFEALIPKFPAQPKIPQSKTEEFFPPESIRGEWTGTIKTYQSTLPAKLTITDSRDIRIEIDGKITRPVPIQTPLGPLSFKDGIFQGAFLGTIPTDDSKRYSHVLFLRLKLRGNKLNGFAATVAINKRFVLPHWIELEK